MNKTRPSFRNLLTNKWTVISSLSTLTFFIILSNLLINRSFIDEITAIIDEELGGRLGLIATKIAENIEYDIVLENLPSSFETLSPNDLIFMNGILETEQRQNDLQAIAIVDRHFRTIISYPAIYLRGEPVTHLASDSLIFGKALQGTTAISKMYSVSDNYFKTAYAPLKNEFGTIIGVVIVDASARHFNTIRGFQRSLNWGLLFTFLIFLIAIAFIYWVVTQYTQLHLSVQRNQRLASMGQMAATVAHEIRNPLGIIKSTAEVIKSRYEKENRADELIDFIPAEVDRLNRLITDFLTFARDRELQLQKTDFHASIEKIVHVLQQDYQDEAIKIQLETAFDGLNVEHDLDGIKQVMINLIQNAAQAMENKGIISVSLDVISKWGKRYVRIQVGDSGPGIAEPERIFEPFFTTKTSGSGLGLAVTQQIILKHQGRIDVENKPEGGAVFTITLPVAQ
ncbi:MAG: hypothetical protein DWQ05_13715 [Calditrichaeota bacterium]|nr:MAG: hypothetical protein DWQ05_13715 [Calditrichota bacterium]